MTSSTTSATHQPAPNAAGSVTRSEDRPSPFFEAAKVSSVGLEMALATGIGWGIGYWLDSKYETAPWLMLVGLLFGVAAGFNGLIRTANQVQANAARDVLEAKTAAGTGTN
tara:strand:- start:12513 stop:12845 length:333 start_codon:yes stop_codon:yes gene_type:complete